MLESKKQEFLQLLVLKMQYLRYAKDSIKVYNHYTDEFLESLKDISPSKLKASDFQSYLDNYDFNNKSGSLQNQVISSLKFFYERVLGHKYLKIDFTRPRKQSKLPEIIPEQHLIDSINAITNKKHKAILFLAYSTGLRVSSILNLKIKDIDSTRMLIHVNNAKGGKDYKAKLTQPLLNLLRGYFKEFHPNSYLFGGQGKEQYSRSSVNAIVKKYIGKQYHIHNLRHNFASSLVKSGVSLPYVKELMNHSSTKTTEIYLHIEPTFMNEIKMPMENLYHE